jgi:hypothetical protein
LLSSEFIVLILYISAMFAVSAVVTVVDAKYTELLFRPELVPLM